MLGKSSRFTLRLRNAGLYTFDLTFAEASKGTLVLGSAELWADGSLELGDGCTRGRFPFASGGCHCAAKEQGKLKCTAQVGG